MDGVTLDSARPRRSTSADVARAAGLSRATVSYVLNQTSHRQIPEGTRRRVLEAAERLHYHPSPAARELRTGRSEVVLCLLPEWRLSNEVGALLETMSTALARRGLTLVTHARARSARPVTEVWRALRPAAVISFESFSDLDAELIRSAGIEDLVELFTASSEGRFAGGQVVDGSTASPPRLADTVTEERKGRLQAEHLAATGHRVLGYARPDDDRSRGFAEPRYQGARRACAELGLDEPVVAVVASDPQQAAQSIARLRGAPSPVTGICAFNDDVAFALLAGAQLLGLAVPADLAVVGVDDIPTARVAIPPLTTVRTDPALFADYYSQVIVARLNRAPDPPRPGPDILTVVRRGTT